MQILGVRFVAGLIEVARDDARGIPHVIDPNNRDVVLVKPEDFKQFAEKQLKEKVPSVRL